MSLYATALRTLVLPPLLHRDKRGSALRHWRFLEQSQFWSRQQLLDYQFERLSALLKHAAETTPFYREVFSSNGLRPGDIKSIEDLGKLPVLTRKHIYEGIDSLISDKYGKDQLQRFTTSGTTAQRAVLYRNQESFNIKLGLQWRHEGWLGRKPGEKMALIWPANMDFEHKGGWRDRFKDRYLWREIMYQAGSHRAAELKQVYENLKSFGARYLKVFPTELQTLAEYIEESGLRPLKMNGILSTGEPLYPHQRQLFRRMFECDVLDMYASREAGNTACEGPSHEGLLIAMETNIVEIVDEHDQPVPPGERGAILITDLTNFGAPMIRYRIHDYGSLIDRPSSCGRGLQLMEPAVGRVTDDLWTADGARHSGHVIGIALTEDGPFFGQFQIVQEAVDHFVVRLAEQPPPGQEHFDHINLIMKKIAGGNVKIDIQVVEHIPQERSGKVRFVICKLNEETKQALIERRRAGR